MLRPKGLLIVDEEDTGEEFKDEQVADEQQPVVIEIARDSKLNFEGCTIQNV